MASEPPQIGSNCTCLGAFRKTSGRWYSVRLMRSQSGFTCEAAKSSVRRKIQRLPLDFGLDWQYIATWQLIAIVFQAFREDCMKKPHDAGLGARERQIMDAIYELREASVAEVLAKLSDPPSYSSVRTMIRSLEAKGHLRHRQVSTRYVYRPAHSRQNVERSALRHLIQTFFGGSATAVVAAILDPSMATLSDDDVTRLELLIQDARRKGK
jgi:BlaI family transcriptional regulator, penicillinase repressor